MVPVPAAHLLLLAPEPAPVTLLLFPIMQAIVCVLLLPFFSQAVASARHLGQVLPTLVHARHLTQ